MNVNRELLAFLRKQYPVGTRIRLDSMQDPYAPVEAGTTGKLDYIDDAGQFHMKWDNGRTLALIPGVDSFTVLPPELSMTKLYMPLTAEFYEPDVYDSMEQINRFAQCLEELDRNNELIKFKAVAGQLDLRSMDDALALAEHLSEYALEPGLHSLEELAREELSVIVNDPDRDLLTRHLNMDAYGADLLWRDQGLFSDYGYICRLDGQPLQVPRQGVDMTMQ